MSEPLNVVLDKGLDTVTHPTLADSGTLIDCLNYEMVADAGYRRIDGYEAYDGWLGGDLGDYYYAAITVTDAAIVPFLVPGAQIQQLPPSGGLTTSLVIGTVLSYSAGLLIYAPANKDAPIVLTGAVLDVRVGGIGGLTVSANGYRGSVTDDANTFVTNLRLYSTQLRTAVTAMPTYVAGLHWFRHNLVAALDCYTMTFTDTDSTERNSVQVGSIIGYLTTRYRVISRTVVGNVMTLELEPLTTQGNNPTITIHGENYGGTIGGLALATGITVTQVSTNNAYLAVLNTPETWTERGRRTLTRSVTLKFSGGVAAAEASFVEGGAVTIAPAGGSAQYATGIIKYFELTSGTFAANNAVGWLELVIDWSSSGAKDYIKTTDDIMIAGITKLADIDSVTWSTIAGTKKLRDAGTRYQWISANFYGQSDTLEMYGATGATKAFWAQAYHTPLTNPVPPGVTPLTTLEFAWGNVWSNRVVTARDLPKYVAYHGGSLALAIAGSVIRSVGGEPRNFKGTEGATENATGDTITGLVEAQGDSLIVFGRRTIRRLTGYSVADLSLQMISGSGCFDYTAIRIGPSAVYCSPAGISTVEQAQSYGDFQGQRITEPVTNTFVPKLITDWSDSEPGGVLMALPVRSKNQYRLWLSTGEVYSVTFTNKGPRVMKSNYGLFSDDVRVPFAWTSELSDSAKERIFLTWDEWAATKQVAVTGFSGTIPNEKAIYELDKGWGFNGRTFPHHFDITYTFGNSQTIQIVGIRMHGMGYGLATLDIKSSGIEEDYEQDWHTQIQDISMPANLTEYSLQMRPVTAIVDQANWGLGVKLRINGTKDANLTTTEPSHICQVLILQVNPTGAKDN